LKREALTGMTGQYHLAGLPGGNYALRIEKPGSKRSFEQELRLVRLPKS
jgi:hypothetical protein